MQEGCGAVLLQLHMKWLNIKNTVCSLSIWFTNQLILFVCLLSPSRNCSVHWQSSAVELQAPLLEPHPTVSGSGQTSGNRVWDERSDVHWAVSQPNRGQPWKRVTVFLFILCVHAAHKVCLAGFQDGCCILWAWPTFVWWQRRALVVRGPSDVRNKELIFLQFSCNETGEDFSAITYMLFEKFSDLTDRWVIIWWSGRWRCRHYLWYQIIFWQLDGFHRKGSV